MTALRKAVALISGGLDSMLAARLMRDQDIHVGSHARFNLRWPGMLDQASLP